MEQNKEMTAKESLSLITETFNKSRKDILRCSGGYFLLWGALLTTISLVIYFLWHYSGIPQWNLLWFAMPVIGYTFEASAFKHNNSLPQNEVSKMLRDIWRVFGAFAIAICVISGFLLSMPLTLIIVIIMGLAECLTGVLLKNWLIGIAGFILGVGGAIFAILVRGDAQLLIFTLGGILLLATGLVIKLLNK